MIAGPAVCEQSTVSQSNKTNGIEDYGDGIIEISATRTDGAIGCCCCSSLLCLLTSR